MATFKIMQEPGRQAHARADRDARQYAVRYTPQMKRAGTEDAEHGLEALVTFVTRRFGDSKQFDGFRIQYRSKRAMATRWYDDDHQLGRDREWSVLVTLKNGRNVHQTRFVAWRAS